ncbi:sialate O-acetylesterase [Mucilaginibacter sp. HMF5004]|uniref:sialate O-acetylesterase n=1 Tax=Mucilaginibacter rivuli TaxID=2857527 RepID=UPI001C5CD3B5|nr:sialate O-acetylesterase [Mucilaginibacter rivuli]MBW4889042.1 sialate O-acetylesterase [Mucilaginibacter rivuli]
MNTIKSPAMLLSLICLCLASQLANAQPKLAALFTDNLVLQQQSTVQVWGWDKPAAIISLTNTWDKKIYKATAGADGKFIIKIATPKAGGPYALTVSDGKAITLGNILIGEVWICTGQSNMELPMKGYKGQPNYGSNEAILNSENKNIRLFTVPRASTTTLQQDAKTSKWLEANLESVSDFSATGYYFGRMLNKMLNVPVGLINCSYSGSSIQAWMDAKTLGAFPEIKVPAPNDTIKEVSRTPTTLYNGMLSPVMGYGIKGAIWYQGESNYSEPTQYSKLFPTFVSMLRQQWGQGDFPFYYCQIAPYDYAQLKPFNKGGKYNSAFVRDVQRLQADKIPNTGMAVLMDIGEQATIHPPHKQQGGERMGLLALAKTYGLKGFGFESPAYDNLTIKNDQAIIKFKNAFNGITANFKELTTFEIAGTDKHFYPAKAVISGGSSITVTSPDVKQPVAVRYAFRDYVMGELFGTDGLPVSSFRTDDWDYNDAQ